MINSRKIIVFFVVLASILIGQALIPQNGELGILSSQFLFADEGKGSEPSSTSRKTYRVTFVELGSDRCIPCRQMKPVMAAIERKYGDQVRVVFYDVWTPEGRPMGRKYGIRIIPTQVFLDEKGNEFFRHEGFFSEEDIVAVLKKKGVR